MHLMSDATRIQLLSVFQVPAEIDEKAELSSVMDGERLLSLAYSRPISFTNPIETQGIVARTMCALLLSLDKNQPVPGFLQCFVALSSLSAQQIE